MKIMRTVFVVLTFLALIGITVSAESISGQVLDYYGTTPVEGVTVQCLETTGVDSTVYRFVTGADGNFSVGVPPATYYVCVNGNDTGSIYIPQYYGGVNYSSYSYTVTVDEGVDVPGILFYMFTGFRVQGKVEFQGAPAEATIIAFDNTTGYYYYGLTGADSGSDGMFKMTLPQGTYEFTAYASGQVQPGMKSPVIINDDRDSTNLINIEIPTTASVSGTVTGPGSEALEEVRVDAFDIENMYTYSYGLTDENGNYTIPGLVTGRTYKFLCRTNFHPSFTYWDFPGTWYPNATDPGNGTSITINPAGHTGINITLDANGGTISGLVTDDEGTPVENAYVYDFYYPSAHINPYVAIAQRSLYTSESGAFTLTGVAGEVGVAVIATGYIPQVYNGQNMTTLLDTGDILNVTPGAEITDVNFSLTPVDELGAGPVVTNISPHLVLKGSNPSITLTGTGFSPSATVDLVDFYPFYYDGEFPTVNVTEITAESITLTINTNASTAVGAYYLAITNPDGQYTLPGFAVINPQAGPTFKILAAPDNFISESTLTLASSVCNLTAQPQPVDGYAGLVLPTGDAIFYDGTNFSMDLLKYFDAETLPPAQFQTMTLEFEIPLGGAEMPPGEYLWFTGLFQPNTWELVDLSLKSVYAR